MLSPSYGTMQRNVAVQRNEGRSLDLTISPTSICGRNETRSGIRVKVLDVLSFVLSTNRQLYEVGGLRSAEVFPGLLASSPVHQ